MKKVICFIFKSGAKLLVTVEDDRVISNVLNTWKSNVEKDKIVVINSAKKNNVVHVNLYDVSAIDISDTQK